MSTLCPECGNKTNCLESRNKVKRGEEFTYRRYECRSCKCRFSTAETLTSIYKSAVKKRWREAAYC